MKATFRLCIAALALLFDAGSASAEPVTYHMTGIVTEVSGTLVSSLFSVGDSFVLDLTVERTTVPLPDKQEAAATYLNAGTSLVFDVGSWQCSGASDNLIVVMNDFPVPQDDGPDQFDYDATGLSTQPLGSIIATEFRLTLGDLAGDALSSVEIPRTMPEPSSWETRTFSIAFAEGLTLGNVAGTIVTSATPASSASWGAIKNLYRQ